MAGRCSGCAWIGRPFAEQEADKAQALRTLWRGAGLPDRDVAIHALAEAGLRDRVDLTLHRQDDGMALGLWDLDRARILHPAACPQLSPALAEVHRRFRADLPDVELGQIRLRVSPSGDAGVWLDLPNTTTRDVLEEGDWLTRLGAWAHVEVGQRRKPVVWEDGRPTLQRQSVLRPWMRTFLGADERLQDLYLTVGDFTQVGVLATRALVRAMREAVASIGARRWLELGSGSGSLTLPLLAEGAQVVAVEMEPRAMEGLRRAAAEAGLDAGLLPAQGSFHRRDPALSARFAAADAVLVDPPRSGLGAAVDALGDVPAQDRPGAIVYVSCFAESLTEDVARLDALGYRCEALQGLDLYPQSPHCEWVAMLRR